MNQQTNDSFFANPFTRTSRMIYTPSAFARSNLLYLQETGTLTALKAHKSGREKIDSFLFFVVVQGGGLVQYESSDAARLQAGDCVFLDCHKPYSHMSDAEQLWTLKWIHFNSPSLHAIYEKYLSRGGRYHFHAKNVQQYIRLLDHIYETSGNNSYIRDMELNSGLNMLLEMIMRETVVEGNPARLPPARPAAKKQFDVRTVKTYLDTHYRERISLDDLAKIFFINKHYLSNLFKSQFGIPVNAYLTQIRITKAKGLLRYSDKTIEEIGYEVGIGNANYFSRIFKTIENCSPSEYRKRW